MQSLALARNLLFTPADRPERFGKAISVAPTGQFWILRMAPGCHPNGKPVRPRWLSSRRRLLPRRTSFGRCASTTSRRKTD